MFLDIIDYFIFGDPDEKFHGQFFTYSAIAFMDIDLVAAWAYMAVNTLKAGLPSFDESASLFIGIDVVIIAIIAALFIMPALRIKRRSANASVLKHLLLVITSSICLTVWAWMA